MLACRSELSSATATRLAPAPSCTLRKPCPAKRTRRNCVTRTSFCCSPMSRSGFRLRRVADDGLDMSSDKAKPLVNLLFLGQYMLMSLMAPSFAAGAITGEKERESYEMLLASPLRPGGDRAGQVRRVALPARRVDDRFAADRDALPAAGWRVVFRSAGRVFGDDFVGRPCSP